MPTLIVPRNLTRQPPHSPRQRVAGFVIAARAVDKCLASLAGNAGEYHFNCPLDNQLFSFKGITGEQFKTAVQSAKNYEDVGAWLTLNGTPKTPAEIKAWSDATEASSPMKVPEKRGHFIESCHKIGLNPETNSTFDWLEGDDRSTFSRKNDAPHRSHPNIPTQGQIMTTKYTKPATSKTAATPETPVFPKELHHLRPSAPPLASGKAPKRANIFSKSRDIREDRDSRQVKTSQNNQTLPHGRT